MMVWIAKHSGVGPVDYSGAWVPSSPWLCDEPSAFAADHLYELRVNLLPAASLQSRESDMSDDTLDFLNF